MGIILQAVVGKENEPVREYLKKQYTKRATPKTAIKLINDADDQQRHPIFLWHLNTSAAEDG